ncbi:GPR endopeptidase [bacterium C-53]|nr:GPR endopeptidase [Lachnospiraceae bacterium]NBI02092.1 GPR endopeptidase [Lachnospiraceae bacterium]RKJ10355.1 GPR endopeptidase [bacterium C-53]
MCDFSIRTDLALEAGEKAKEEKRNLRGVNITEEYIEDAGIQMTKVVIESKNGAKELGKPMGTYVTLEAPDLAEPDEGYHREVSRELANQIKQLIPEEKDLSVLVVGLGNREVTPDALGPNVVNNLLITRHMIKEFGKAAYEEEKNHLVSGIVPGVMAQTGMETAEILRGIIKETKPDMVVVIDALAARSTKRLNRTIQITNTGIHPGSGVGNNRNAITQESLGVPVIAVGIPTVVDAATIVKDAMDNTLSSQNVLKNMFVTPKDVDENVKRLSYTISEALNIALS